MALPPPLPAPKRAASKRKRLTVILGAVTQDMIASLNPNTELSDIETELFDEIAYPRNQGE